MDKYSSSCYYARAKLMDLFDLHTLEGIKYCNEKLDEISEKLEGMVGKKVIYFRIVF